MNSLNHNMSSMNAQRHFGINNRLLTSSTEKLSSGYKINRAADNAAGLTISEKMRGQIRGLTKAADNTMNGMSLCSVADGALNEVNNILNRMHELAVQAANDTYTDTDRIAIQAEIDQLIEEIDRIGKTTEFNTIPIFTGTDEIMRNADGTPAIEGNIPFSDFSFADVNIGEKPINSSCNSNYMCLQAIVNNPTSASHLKRYNMIFGNGSTSSSTVRIDDKKGHVAEVGLESFDVSGFDDSTSGKWTRNFSYSDTYSNITIKQTITADSANKKYNISYEITNNGTSAVDVDFMFHADTAYNNNDTCEGYFINGTRVDKYCMYAGNNSDFHTSSNSNVDKSGIPNSLSIIDVDNALAFSECISFSSDKPDTMSLGHYSDIRNWSYYNNLDSNLGNNAIRSDLGFSLIWNHKTIANGASKTSSFSYGIVEARHDNNLNGQTIVPSQNLASQHFTAHNFWIQSGSNANEGVNLVINEMNSDILGIKGLSMSDSTTSTNNITKIQHAVDKVVADRTNIGAWYNRLEHSYANDTNAAENLTNAESRIRDTDIADEMLKHSKSSILAQTSQSMISQANQSKQGILELLR